MLFLEDKLFYISTTPPTPQNCPPAHPQLLDFYFWLKTKHKWEAYEWVKWVKDRTSLSLGYFKLTPTWLAYRYVLNTVKSLPFGDILIVFPNEFSGSNVLSLMTKLDSLSLPQMQLFNCFVILWLSSLLQIICFSNDLIDSVIHAWLIFWEGRITCLPPFRVYVVWLYHYQFKLP